MTTARPAPSASNASPPLNHIRPAHPLPGRIDSNHILFFSPQSAITTDLEIVAENQRHTSPAPHWVRAGQRARRTTGPRISVSGALASPGCDATEFEQLIAGILSQPHPHPTTTAHPPASTPLEMYLCTVYCVRSMHPLLPPGNPLHPTPPLNLPSAPAAPKTTETPHLLAARPATAPTSHPPSYTSESLSSRPPAAPPPPTH